VDLAADNLRFLSKDLVEFGVVDKVIPEPPGGAHIDQTTTFKNVNRHLRETLKKLEEKTPETRIEERYQKFRKIGVFTEK
jgi:acetyl-CoA carboxylase carboxyl transferase subunit alpha